MLVDPRCGTEAALALGELGVADRRVRDALTVAARQPAYAYRAAWLLDGIDAQGSEARVREFAHAGALASAIASIEASGDPRFMWELIRWMGHDEVGDLAGEAFRCITGVDLDEHDLVRTIDRDEASADAEGADYLPERRQLSWPAELAVARDWQERASSFATGTRYLAGLPIAGCESASASACSLDNLVWISRSARARQRAMAAQRLRFQQGGALLATRAFLPKRSQRSASDLKQPGASVSIQPTTQAQRR
jgi:hypothetical protein